MHGSREGDGIISISADGQTCTYISRWGGLGHNPGGGATAVPAPTPIGGGFDIGSFPVQGLLSHDGLIYGVSNDDLYSFNLTNGMQSVSTTMLTNGNGIAFGGVILDPDNNDIVFAVLRSGGLMKMELSTFNNFVFSW